MKRAKPKNVIKKRLDAPTASAIASTRKRHYPNIGQAKTIKSLHQAKQMAPPKGVSGKMHIAVINDEIGMRQSSNARKRQMKSMGAW